MTLKTFLKPQNLILAVTFFLSILFTYSYIDFQSNMSVGAGHVYTAKSIALSQDFNVNEYWGNSGVDIFIYNGNHYVAYAFFNSLLMAIPYFFLQVIYYLYTNFIGNVNGDISIILESITFSSISSLALAGLGLFFYKYIRKNFNKETALTALSGLILGTLIFNYSVSFFNHVIAAFFVFLSFYFYKKDKLFLSGILTGLAFITEYPTILFSISIGIVEIYKYKNNNVYFKKFIKNICKYGAGVLIFLLIQLIFNKIHFDGFFNFSEFIYKNQKQLSGQDFDFFKQNPIWGVYGLLFSPLKGIFLYSPFLLFFFLGLKKFYKKNKEDFIIASSYIAIIVFTYSLWDDCFGATSYGSRYMISTIPFILLTALYSLNSKLSRSIFKVLMIISVTITLITALDGIAWGKFGQCEEYINLYTPYIKTKGFLTRLFEGNPRFAPVIFEYLNERFF